MIEQRRFSEAKAQRFVESGERSHAAKLMQGRSAIRPGLRAARIERDGAIEPDKRRLAFGRREINQSGEIRSLRSPLVPRLQQADAGAGGGDMARFQMLDRMIEGGVDGGFLRGTLRAAAPAGERRAVTVLRPLELAVHTTPSSEALGGEADTAGRRALAMSRALKACATLTQGASGSREDSAPPASAAPARPAKDSRLDYSFMLHCGKRSRVGVGVFALPLRSAACSIEANPCSHQENALRLESSSEVHGSVGPGNARDGGLRPAAAISPVVLADDGGGVWAPEG